MAKETEGGMVEVDRRVIGAHPSGATMILASIGDLVTPEQWAEIEANETEANDGEIVTAPAGDSEVVEPADKKPAARKRAAKGRAKK